LSCPYDGNKSDVLLVIVSDFSDHNGAWLETINFCRTCGQQWFQFILEDVPLNDSIMWMAGIAIFR